MKEDGATDQDYFENLGILLDCVKEDCHAIYIVCSNLDDAYELFQVLNDRGKSLTDGNLLRAYTFQEMHKLDKSRKYYDSLRPYWDEILSYPDGSIKHFLEQYLRAETGQKAQKKQLYRQYQTEIFEKDQTSLEKNNEDLTQSDRREGIRDRVAHMRDQYRIFAKLADGQWPYETIPHVIEEYDKYRLYLLVKTLGLKNISILMAAHEKLDQKIFRDLVYLIERFFFRYRTICKGSADTIGNTFGDHANRIMQGTFDVSAFKKHLNSLIVADAPDETFKEQLRLTLMYKDSNVKQRIKYFLVFLEDHRKLYQDGVKKGNRKIDKTTLPVIEKSTSLEHIYPQKPTTKDDTIIKHESRGDLTNCLGNLTFLGRDDNTSLGNKPYSAKKKEFLAGNIWLNRQTAQQYDKWTAENILARETWLLEQAVKLFCI
jgi:hypothetical protein